MDTGKIQDTSTGKKSSTLQTETLANAKDSGKAEKPLPVVQAKLENNSSCKTLAEQLSILQEDLSQLTKTLAKFQQKESVPVSMLFDDKGGVIYIAPIEGHAIAYSNGHILLDDVPVTGWEPKDTGK